MKWIKIEYEYSFNVNDIKEYVNYCKNNNYILKNNTRQIVTIYRNNRLIARITKDIHKNKTTYSLNLSSI